MPDSAKDPTLPSPCHDSRIDGASRWWILGLCLVIAAAYSPAFTAGFVWDDAAHVTAPELRSAAGLLDIWLKPGATQQYYPLLHTLFWIEHALWRADPMGYHIVNVVLHALAAGLFGLLLRRLAVPGAWLAAGLFAVHPVAVETVAWVSEQKNTLSTVLYLAAALSYVAFTQSRRKRHYALALGLFLLALLSKTVTATLPAALLVILWWRNGHLAWRRDALPLLPWFGLSVAAAALTIWVERRFIGAEGADFSLGALERLLLAARTFWFYVGKLLWPADLMFNYPRWIIDLRAPGLWLSLFAVAGLLGTGFAWRKRSRAFLAVILLFGGTLVPALGFINVYPFKYSYVADHFQYLASLAVFAGAGALVARVTATRPLAQWAVIGILGVGLGIATWRHAGDFRDSQTLWRRTIEKNPQSWLAYNNLGLDLLAAPATWPEAIACFRKALELKPDYAEALTNLGFCLYEQQHYEEAQPFLEAAVRLKPRLAHAQNNLGRALARDRRYAEAAEAFRQAAREEPKVPLFHENLAKALQLTGRPQEASLHFAEARRLRDLQAR